MDYLKNLNITFLAGTLGKGGAEKQLYYNLKVLVENNAKVTLLCLSKGEYWEQKIKDLNIPIIWVGENPSRLKRLIKIRKELKKIAPNIFQSQHFYTNIYVSLSTWFLKTKSIGAIRSNAKHEFKNNGILFGKANLLLPNFLFVNSKNGVNNAIKLGAKEENIFFLQNVIDTNLFKPSQKLNTQTIQIIAIGTLKKVKRFDRLIKIISKVTKNSSKKIIVNIFGDGSEKKNLENLIQKKKLENVIFLRGNTNHVHKELVKTDIFILTSDFEGTPNVVMEAMACGIPVISTLVGDIKQLVTHTKSGFIYDKNDIDGMADTCKNLIQNEHLRKTIGQESKLIIDQKFAITILKDKLLELYTYVLAS